MGNAEISERIFSPVEARHLGLVLKALSYFSKRFEMLDNLLDLCVLKANGSHWLYCSLPTFNCPLGILRWVHRLCSGASVMESSDKKLQLLLQAG